MEQEEYLQKIGIKLSKKINLSADKNNFFLEPPCVIHADVFYDSLIKVGAFTGIFGGRLRYIEIGRYCSIAHGLQCGWDEHPIDRITTSMVSYVPNIHGWADILNCNTVKTNQKMIPYKGIKGITSIGHDVWIGQGVFLRTGITIGNGAIIGANAVVLKDVPAYAIVGGNPAKIIRYRFPDNIIEKMQKICWWDYNLLDCPIEQSANPEQFLDNLEEMIEKNSLSKYNPKILNHTELNLILKKELQS